MATFIGIEIMDYFSVSFKHGIKYGYSPMKKPTILIIRMGNTYRDLSKDIGNFDQWIKEAAPELPLKWKTQKIDHVIPEEIDKYQGIILTGAHNTLTEHYPFMKGMERILQKIIDNRIMTLGICFGHQILNLLLGGKVVRNPLGPEIGVTKINLTLAGMGHPLFKGLNIAKLEVYESHYDIVSSVADSVIALAWNEMSEYQVCVYEGFIYGTQFHPEYSKKIMEFYIRKNYDNLKNEHFRNPLNIPTPEEILKRNKNISKSRLILDNFLYLIIRKNPL